MFLHKSHIWEKSCSWAVCQNPLSQSDCSIFNLTISLKQIYEKALNWYKFSKNECWSKRFWVGMIKNGCSQSIHRTLKLTVPQELTYGINWVSACWYKFRKGKSSFNRFWVDMVKNGCGLLFHDALKSVVS